MPRLVLWRLVAAAGLLVGLLLPQAGTAAQPCTAVTRVGDGWDRVRQPAGLGTVKVFGVSPRDPRRIWVSDGRQVARTVDGGCTWLTVYWVPVIVTVNGGDPENYITQVLVSGSPGAETVWVVDQGGSLAGEPRVPSLTVARNGTDDFSASTGLPPVGGLLLAVGAGSGGAFAVTRPVLSPGLGVGLGAEENATIYTTTDAGASWTRGAALPTGFDATGASVAPQGGLYAWSASVLLTSADGAGVAPVRLPVSRFSAVSVGRLLTVFPGGRSALVSADGGASFTNRTVPDGVRGAAEVPGTDVIGIATPNGTLLWNPVTAAAVDLTPRGLELGELAGARGSVPTLFGRSGPVLAWLPLNATGRPVRPPSIPVKVALVPPPRVAPPPSVLTPASTVLSLAPGETRRVDYRLALPPVPGPLDVYFLIDTTGSMQPAIDGLRRSIQGIVDALAATNFDVQMGLGDFRDVDDSEALGGWVYHRGQHIAPPGEGLRQALVDLRIQGGGDYPEADTIALTQAVTGAGQAGVVKAGQEAGFRQGATRVVVLITDAPFHVEPPVYPSFPETVGTLTRAGVKVLGVSIGDGAVADLGRLARDTGTLTPEGGIDCGGDGVAEVAEGQPAVCQIDHNGRGAARLSEPIIALLKAVEQPGRVRVQATGTAVARVVGDVDRVMDLARPQAMAFAVDYACGRSDKDTELTADLRVSADGRPVAGAVARVRCGGPAVAPRPPDELPPINPQVAAVVVPIAVPPGQLPPPQPVTNPQSAPQPGSAVNPNVVGVAAEQHQKQVQLALAVQEAEPVGGGEQLAMVGRPPREELAAARRLLATSLVLTAIAGAVGLRRQRQFAAVVVGGRGVRSR